MAESIAQFPEKLQFLFRPSRYKVAYGGRSSGKSWGFARALLIRAVQGTVRVLCTRQLQNSIKDSVHRLLSDQIEAMGLSGQFEIQRDLIRCTATGSEFLFKGIQHNVQEIKSTEGIDICWAEEAQLMTAFSWGVLIPTIRKPGSEIWVSFNPNLETDDTYVRFVLSPPPTAIVAEINWRDNPWFDKGMLAELEHLRATDYDEYLHIWEGKCRQILKGAVYANELRLASAEGRILAKPQGGVPYDRSSPVNAALDLGRADMTSIWFFQEIAFQVRFLHFHEDQGLDINPYIKYMQNLPYTYGTIFLPHDGAAHTIGTKLSVEEQMRAHFPRIRVLPKTRNLSGDINIVRGIFPKCYFDAEGCKEGLNALRNYKFDVIPGSSTLSSAPVHDWASHGADAFRYATTALRPPKKKRQLELLGGIESVDLLSGAGLEDDLDAPITKSRRSSVMDRLRGSFSSAGTGWLK